MAAKHNVTIQNTKMYTYISAHWALHRLKFLERIHVKVMFPTYNSLQSSQPTYFRELFTIQPTHELYPILLLCHPFSTFDHFLSHLLQPSHIHHCTTSLKLPTILTFGLPRGVVPTP